MRRLVILGAGTAGTMMLNKLARVLNGDQWQITVIDGSETHLYQPGFLFIPFGVYRPEDVVKPRREFFPPNARVVISNVDHIDADRKRVILEDESAVDYDYLIISTGTTIRPDQTEGLLDDEWGKTKFDFYTLQGAERLHRFFQSWQGGRLVLNIAEMPIKCPVAPLEFLFLADSYFTARGIRDKVELRLATPLSGAFTKPKATEVLGDLLERKNIKVTPDFGIARVDNERKTIVSYDEVEVPYDVLISIPTNMGDESIARSGLGDELNYVPTDKETLQAQAYDDIFVIGDAGNLPSSKAGSVAHFQSEILFKNFLDRIEGRPMSARFDGHANCFIESGFGKALLIDFNYNVEPLPGKFPLPGIGPFSLLQETRMNHYGKLAFRWSYWNVLIRGAELPIDSKMSMVGKVA
ncbi:MAG TPA: FAD/NAD(P)-binding oxidoreductase [Candidatus Dormibacteraeota bacterium]|nr:FAD/NAD(P)-binding oxidoreductase [Candidatus Dormibacteraeota bacterium]